MRYLITLLLAALSLNAFGQTNPNYNPDYDANGSISVNDLLGFLSIFGDTWDSGDVIMGCTYSNATDYNPLATIDDGSCTFLPDCAGDECGVCGGSGIADGACDCDGNVLDECGVCGGDNSTCLDCCGIPFGDGTTCDSSCGPCNDDTSCLDECGVPNGDNSTCLDDCGVPNGDNSTCLDCCGVVNGDGSTCYGPCGACNDDTSCLDDCGVPNGDNSTCLDCCGVVNGDGSTCDGSCGACNDNTSCLDDCGVPNGDNSTCLDDCGVPNGDNSTCFAGCGDGIMHDGHDYSTVQIGDHCWFSENCRYLPSVSPSSSSSTTIPSYYVFGYEGSDVAIAKSLNDYSVYGALYNWPAVMEPGICPSGWHIPSDLDWQIMEISLGMSAADAASYGERGSPVGNYLKSTWSWYGGGNGTNSSGFNGLAVGFTEAYQNTSGFYDYGYGGYWWSSSASGSSYAYYRTLYDGYDSVGRYNYNTNRGMSARCVQD
jgi:uncharacterized protein (TIGR02145 family)